MLTFTGLLEAALRTLPSDSAVKSKLISRGDKSRRQELSNQSLSNFSASFIAGDMTAAALSKPTSRCCQSWSSFTSNPGHVQATTSSLLAPSLVQKDMQPQNKISTESGDHCIGCRRALNNLQAPPCCSFERRYEPRTSTLLDAKTPSSTTTHPVLTTGHSPVSTPYRPAAALDARRRYIEKLQPLGARLTLDLRPIGGSRADYRLKRDLENSGLSNINSIPVPTAEVTFTATTLLSALIGALEKHFPTTPSEVGLGERDPCGGYTMKLSPKISERAMREYTMATVATSIPTNLFVTGHQESSLVSPTRTSLFDHRAKINLTPPRSPIARQTSKSQSLTPGHYFVGLYLATLLAVFMKTLWTIVLASFKMMEPFQQLAKKSGAPTKASVFPNFSFPESFKTSPQKSSHINMITLISTTIHAIFMCITPLAAEAITVQRLHRCSTAFGPCPHDGWWAINRRSARALEVFLVFNCCLILALIFVKRNRPSGVYSNPWSIAAIASLLHHPDVLADFRRKDRKAPTKHSAETIESRYILASYRSIGGSYHYGLVRRKEQVLPLDEAPEPEKSADQPLPKSVKTRIDLGSLQQMWRPLQDICLGLILLTLLALITTYYLDLNHDAFNGFFNAESFGPRFLLTGLATIIDAQWKRLEREIRVMMPFRTLCRRNGRPESTILATTTLTPLTAIPAAVRRGDLFLSLIAFVASTSEVLAIAVAGIPLSPSSYFPAYLASV
jgi:hypothetical protein